jgi:mutator protein MutT
MTTTCVLAIITDGQQVLLAMKKRGFGSGYWNGPGGKVKEGESLQAALKRECFEEVSITLTKCEKVATHDYKFPDGQSDMVVHTYLCTEWDGEAMESEEMAPRWFDIAELPYDQMWQDDRYWLPLVLAGKKLKTDFTFDHEQNMLAYAVNEVEKLA